MRNAADISTHETLLEAACLYAFPCFLFTFVVNVA